MTDEFRQSMERSGPWILWAVRAAQVITALIILGGALQWTLEGRDTWSSWQDSLEAVPKLVEDMAWLRGQMDENERQRQQLLDVLQQQARQIEILSAPRVFVHYGRARALSACSPERECVVEFAGIRRVAGANECRVIPGATEHIVVSDQDGRRRFATQISNGNRVNLSDQDSTLEIRLRMPDGMPPGPAMYRVVTYYQGCPWQRSNDDPPVSQSSPPVPIIVVEE